MTSIHERQEACHPSGGATAESPTAHVFSRPPSPEASVASNNDEAYIQAVAVITSESLTPVDPTSSPPPSNSPTSTPTSPLADIELDDSFAAFSLEDEDNRDDMPPLRRFSRDSQGRLVLTMPLGDFLRIMYSIVSPPRLPTVADDLAEMRNWFVVDDNEDVPEWGSEDREEDRDTDESSFESENDEDQENIPPLVMPDEMERRARDQVKTKTRCGCDVCEKAEGELERGEYSGAQDRGSSRATECLE